jgi:hypothetical protein
MMTKDKALEELFLAHKPQYDDEIDFMVALNKRLDAVEYIKQHQEATLRRYKIAMVAAFIVGIISSAATITFLLTTPPSVPLYSFSIQIGWLMWLSENSRMITATVLALFMSFGIISVFSNVQEILSMQSRLKMEIHRK